MENKYKYFLLLLILPVFFSCVNTRKATYFNDITDTELEYKVENLEPVIQKNDILSISINSINSEATQLLNLYTISNSPGNVNSGTITQSSGYLVDQDGNIQLPILGTIRAAGQTKKQLKEIIVKSILQKNLLYDPVVNIRYLNYKVTVLGEVAHPTVINVPGEKISLLEALGLAGDLTLFAQRDNILIIHEEEGKRTTRHINLNDKDVLTSPYYYLRSNDVVYVAPNSAKVASTSNAKQWLPTIFGGLSLIAVLVDRITR